jgi:hypothetical protein
LYLDNSDILIVLEFRLFEDWDSQFSSATSLRKERLQKLLESINIEFPNNEVNALIWAISGGAIMLYSLGMNGPALVELQGILETFCIREIPRYLCHNDSHVRSMITELVEKKSLVDLAYLLNKLGVWSGNDFKFAKRLNRLRNGVAHRNPKLLKQSSLLNIDYALAKIDLIPFLIKSITLLWKLFIFSSSIKYPLNNSVKEDKIMSLYLKSVRAALGIAEPQR